MAKLGIPNLARSSEDGRTQRMRRTLFVAAFLTALPAIAAHGQSAGGPLLQPGESWPTAEAGSIQLHPPKTAHKHDAPKYKLMLTPPLAIGGSGQADEIRLHMPEHTVRTAHVPRTRTARVPSAPKAASAIPFSFDEGNTFAARPETADAPASRSSPAPAPQSPAPPPPAAPAPATHATRVASLPPKPAPAQPTGARPAAAPPAARVVFDKGALAPSPVQYQALKSLAGTLSSALESGASGIQLQAYGGSPGDKSSDARRVSLKRALSVRQLLIDDGVPSARITVRAMGGADDRGPPDRVDVFVRAG